MYSIINSIKFGFMCLNKSNKNNKLETFQNILFTLFDLFSAKIFIKYKNKYNLILVLFFFNSLAHAQHKAWDKDFLSKE